MSRGPRAARTAVLAVAALSGAAALHGQDLHTLLQAVPAEFAGYVAEMGPGAVAAEVDLDLVRSDPERLALPLPDGRSLLAERGVFEDRGDGNVLWTGRVQGADYEGVQLTLHNGHLTAWLGEPNRVQYHLQAGPDGRGRLAPAGGPPAGFCPEPVIAPGADAPLATSGPEARTGSADGPRRIASASNHDRLDIAVFYTEEALANWRGAGGAEAALQAAFDYLNRVLRNGEIPITANLVHSEIAPVELDTPVSTLFKLRWNARTARERARREADLVHLFNAEPFEATQACGRAYIFLKRHSPESFAPWGQGWTSNGEECGYQWSLTIFAHEVGHNLGAAHDPDNSTLAPADLVAPYAYGHTDLTTSPAIATVMSYGAGGRRTEWEPFFSSVRHQPSGWTIGIAGERENERALQQTVHRAVQFGDHAQAEIGPPPPWPPVDVEGRATSSRSVHLTWVDDAHDEVGYQVWGRVAGGEWEQLSVLPADSEEERVTGLLAGRLYEFAVGAYNDNATNNVAYGTWVTVQLPAPEKPAAPSGLAAAPLDNASVRLTWVDNSDDEDGFEVQLRPPDGGWRRSARLAADAESADVKGLEPGGRYRFRVSAYNAGGSSFSNTATVTLPEVEYADCEPSAPQIAFDHGYAVSMCVEYRERGDGPVLVKDAVDYGLDSRQSGLLYFFDRDNAEVLIKVLDACAVNGHRWVFVAPVTTLAFNLRVEETATGQIWRHRNPRGGGTAATKSDLRAFPCEAAASPLVATVGDGGLRGAAPVDAGVQAARLDRAPSSTLFASPREPATAVAQPIESGEETTCQPMPVLSLRGGYTVSMCVEYLRDDQAVVAGAKDYGLDSEQSGLLYFFDRDNAEVLIKVLDGCAVNGSRWVFVAPVTNLAFNLAVESPDGKTWTHNNVLGRTAESKSDIAAFRCGV